MIYDVNEITPVYLQDKNVLLMKSGSIAVVYKVELPEIYTLGEDKINEIISVIGKSIYSLIPEQTVIQFQYFYNIEKIKSDFLKKETFLQKSTYNHFKNRRFLKQELFVYFILPEIASYKASFSSFIIKSKKTDIKIKINKIQEFADKVSQAANVLSSYGYFKFTDAKDYEIENIINKYFSFSSNSHSDLIREKTKLKKGEQEIKIYSLSDADSLLGENIKAFVKDRERSTDISDFIRPLTHGFGLEMFSNHIVNLVIYYDSQKYWKNRLERETKQLIGAKKLSSKNEIYAEENEIFLKEAEEKKIVRFHYSVMFWNNNEKDLKKTVDYVETVFNKIGVKPYNVKYDIYFYLLAMFPGNADRMPIDETILTYDEFPFILFYPEQNYRVDTEGFLFNDRLSQSPIAIDTFSKPYKQKIIDNRNFLVIAPTGGGKSFLMKHILRQFIEKDKTNTVVLNIGGDDKIARVYKKDSMYFEYKEGEPLPTNPFYIEKILTPDKLEFLIDFIEILWKNGKEIDNDERSSIELLIVEFYKADKKIQEGYVSKLETEKMNIGSFYNFIEIKKDEKIKVYDLIDLKSLYLNIQKFATGTYSNLFLKGKPEIQAEKKYIEFELDSIKDNKILFPIFGMLISDLTFNTIWKNKENEKLFFMDEAWLYLEKPGMAALIKYLFKTIRKFKGAVGIAVQQVSDISNDKTGKAIIGNTAVKYLLNHSAVKDEVPELQKRLSLSEEQKSQLLSVRNVRKGKYPHTEILLMLGTRSIVLRLEVSKEAAVIYESDKDKLKIFNDIYNKTNDIEKTVSEIINLKK